VVSFPSTVVHTLPVVLDGAGVEIVVRDVPDDWFAPQTTKRADEFLAHVSSSASSRHRFAMAAG
jgi:hypothetical protein